MSPSPTTPAWWLIGFGVVMLVAALAVVCSRRVVRVAYWLVIVLVAQACCFLVLGADFLAWVQILISIGAVVVLVLFGLMLTSGRVGPLPKDSGREPGAMRTRTGQAEQFSALGAAQSPPCSLQRRIAAALVALAFAGVLITASLQALPTHTINLYAITQQRSGGAQAVGEAIFSTWVWPFELLSVLLLSALVGAIAVSLRRGSDEPENSDHPTPQPASMGPARSADASLASKQSDASPASAPASDVGVRPAETTSATDRGDQADTPAADEGGR